MTNFPLSDYEAILTNADFYNIIGEAIDSGHLHTYNRFSDRSNSQNSLSDPADSLHGAVMALASQPMLPLAGSMATPFPFPCGQQGVPMEVPSSMPASYIPEVQTNAPLDASRVHQEGPYGPPTLGQLMPMHGSDYESWEALRRAEDHPLHLYASGAALASNEPPTTTAGNDKHEIFHDSQAYMPQGTQQAQKKLTLGGDDPALSERNAAGVGAAISGNATMQPWTFLQQLPWQHKLQPLQAVHNTMSRSAGPFGGTLGCGEVKPSPLASYLLSPVGASTDMKWKNSPMFSSGGTMKPPSATLPIFKDGGVIEGVKSPATGPHGVLANTSAPPQRAMAAVQQDIWGALAWLESLDFAQMAALNAANSAAAAIAAAAIGSGNAEAQPGPTPPLENDGS